MSFRVGPANFCERGYLGHDILGRIAGYIASRANQPGRRAVVRIVVPGERVGRERYATMLSQAGTLPDLLAYWKRFPKGKFRWEDEILRGSERVRLGLGGASTPIRWEIVRVLPVLVLGVLGTHALEPLVEGVSSLLGEQGHS